MKTATPHRVIVPERIRFLGVVMVGAYVLINAILAALAPVTSGWPVWGATALAVPPMVLAMVYLVIPIARRAEQA